MVAGTEKTLDSGAHPLVAVYMSENIGGPSLPSLPVSIHKRGVRLAVFTESVEGGNKHRDRRCSC